LAFIEGIQGISVVTKNTFILENKNNIQISPKISLGFTFTHDKAETERRRALRALLLCIGTTLETAISGAKQYFKNKSIGDLTDEIKNYFPLTGSDEDSVLRIITDNRFIPKGGAEHHTEAEFYKYTRKALLGNQLAGCGNCYSGALLFLYLGGVVSLRWLKQHGKQQGTAAPTHLFTFGPRITDPNVAETIPQGKFLYYCRPYGGVHYAISIGNRKCVGHHNSLLPFWPQDKVHYGDPPGTDYSTFSIAGYLLGCQNELTRAKRKAEESFVQYASCVPRLRF
jgi:hypothetical protein